MKSLTYNEIFGNWATLLLTTDSNGKMDLIRLNDEIEVLLASQPNGIYSNGTAGEFYTQTEEEFFIVNEMLARKCERAKIPFQIGVSHMSPQISLERLLRIKHFHPGAIQVILPDWFPPTLEESIIFLKKIAKAADDINLVLYNPPHAKKMIEPTEWKVLKETIPTLTGIKVSDQNSNIKWYKSINENCERLSVFIPGHHLATGISLGAHGSYSNMACLNPFAAQKWYDLCKKDMEAALELEGRIKKFMQEFIEPFITKYHYPNHACDRFMALIGGWADIGSQLRWPYRSIPADMIEPIKKSVKNIIPEFLIFN